MNASERLHGILTALITPLQDDGEHIDTDGLCKLIDHVLAAGGTGVVVLGGTGEYTALSTAERHRAISTAVQHTAGRAPVIAGIVAPGIGDARDIARYAAGEGADFIMPVTPYYVQPTQQGLRDWHLHLASATNLPMILYNIPYRTGGVNMTPQTVMGMVEETDLIAGIKECASDMGQVAELIQMAGDRISVLSGEEHFALPEFLLGAKGAILASANAIPSHWVRLHQACLDGRFADARDTYLEILPLLRALFSETNPGPLKTLMTMLGLPSGPVSTPLVPPSEATVARLKSALERLAVPV